MCAVLLIQVSLLAEGQSLPLTELSELISKTLSGNSSSGSQGKQAATPAPTGGSPGEAAGGSGSAAGSQEAPAAAAGGSSGAGPSALVVRNLIQEVASRKSYGLQDGESCRGYGPNMISEKKGHATYLTSWHGSVCMICMVCMVNLSR